MHSEQISLITENDTRVYRRRWWALAVFCACGLLDALSWNTWGPIAESLEVVFRWSDGHIALLHILGNITYIIVVIPGSVFMDTKGLRITMILSALCLVFLTAIRCLTLDPTIFTVLTYISAVGQGFVGVLPYAAPSLLAAVWFPVEERPTATAIASFFSYFGVSMSFIVGPHLVPGPIYQFTNSTSNHTTSHVNHLREVTNMHELRYGISQLMLTQCGCSVVLLIVVLTTFPDKPPSPPSITASLQRTDYREALTKIARNAPLWLVALAGAFPTGVAGMWISIIDVILKSIGVSQVDAGWMGFWSTSVGCFSGIFIARYSTMCLRRRKFCIATVFTAAIACTVWFSLIVESVLPCSLISLYVSCILVGIFTHGTFPLFYEIAAEASYPVGEGVTGGFLTFLNNVFATVFLSLVAIPNIGITWINWTVAGALIVSIPMLLVFPERYKRSDIDTNTNDGNCNSVDETTQ